MAEHREILTLCHDERESSFQEKGVLPWTLASRMCIFVQTSFRLRTIYVRSHSLYGITSAQGEAVFRNRCANGLSA